MVLYGHTPVPSPEWVNNTLCLDTGCVFGGQLTACRYPERELVTVPAERVWYEPARPFPSAGGHDVTGGGNELGNGARSAAACGNEQEMNANMSDDVSTPGASSGVGLSPMAGAAVPRQEPDALDLTDVIGRRVIETSYHGRITVRAEHAAGALEVMSRFALSPQWLLYLPPTMAPCATSARPGLLEHPAEAFDAYRADGVERVICQEKHMGSRAVVLVCRAADVAAARFGVNDGSTGAVHTRTGRPFLDPDLTEALLGRVREAVTTAGLFEELDTNWLLLDCELLPWSFKAEQLLRHQYATVGAAARSALPAAVTTLEAAAAVGLDVADLMERTRARAENTEAFTAAYRRYYWPVDGLEGVGLAPFQVLACEGKTFHDRDHGWHLSVVDRLVEAAPDLLRRTAHTVVDLTDPAQTDRATSWWEHLTDTGGEGMVVKPYANLTRGRRGLVQPGIKVRGREYLRIIYGPDYTSPEDLTRLRDRNLGRKRSLALREYALGLQALERAAAAEPLWRVHEAVFAVLVRQRQFVIDHFSLAVCRW
jgi:protein phosphatase